MKRSGFALVVVIVFGITLLGTYQMAPGLAQNWPAAPDHARVTTAIQGPSIMFIENVGQFAEGARFQVRGGDHTIWLAEGAIWITVFEQRSKGAEKPGRDSPLHPRTSAPSPRHGVNLKLSFVGANPHPHLEPFNRLETHISFFIGNDPEKWRPDVPVWASVTYKNLYPGLDLELTGDGGWLTPRLIAHTGADLSVVRLRVEGADTMAPDGDHIRITTALGTLTLPLLYAVTADGASLLRAGERPEVRGIDITAPFSSAPSPVSTTAQTAGAFDLLYATFLGGGSDDWGSGIVVDGNGNAYVTGETLSSDFPATPGAFDTSYSGGYGDVFVAKLTSTGSTLAYATFLGGSSDDTGRGITLDGSGNAYVTGWTESSDFPTTSGAFDTSFGGGVCILFPIVRPCADVFVVKLDQTGSTLAYATFLGGSNDDWGSGISMDGSGNVYVTGNTNSSDFSTTPGAFDTSYNGDSYDAFIVKLNPTGSALAYATFLGGSDDDYGFGIAVDGNSNAYVTGDTRSPDFPTTSGTFDTSYNGGFNDAFMVKLNPTGSALVYATFLGGSGQDSGYSIAVDGSSNAYVTGETFSSNFPTTSDTFDTSYNDNVDAFVVKLNPTGSILAYGTFLGGSGGDSGHDLTVDGSGNAYVAGFTNSSDFPTTPGVFDTSFNGRADAFVVRLNPSGSALAYATFLGGGGSDGGSGIAVDGSGNAYITGWTDSYDFPTTPGAFDTTYNIIVDSFVAKLTTSRSRIIFPAIMKNYTSDGQSPTPTLPTHTPTPSRTPTAMPSWWISNFRVSDRPGGPWVDNFPTGTSVIYAVFDYWDAQNMQVEVRVYDTQGNRLHTVTKTYNGAGTDSIGIDHGAPFPDTPQGQAYLTNIYIYDGYQYFIVASQSWTVGSGATPPPGTPTFTPTPTLTPTPTATPTPVASSLPDKFLFTVGARTPVGPTSKCPTGKTCDEKVYC